MARVASGACRSIDCCTIILNLLDLQTFTHHVPPGRVSLILRIGTVSRRFRFSPGILSCRVSYDSCHVYTIWETQTVLCIKLSMSCLVLLLFAQTNQLQHLRSSPSSSSSLLLLFFFLFLLLFFYCIFGNLHYIGNFITF